MQRGNPFAGKMQFLQQDAVQELREVFEELEEGRPARNMQELLGEPQEKAEVQERVDRLVLSFIQSPSAAAH